MNLVPEAAYEGSARSLQSEPDFIGREKELTRIQNRLAQARVGRPQLVLLEGQSGRGKSRLIRELVERVSREVLVLQGEGVSDCADRPLQVLHGPVSELVELAQASSLFKTFLMTKFGSWSSALCSILPDFSAIYSEQSAVGSSPESFNEDRTLLALCRLTDSLGACARPVLLVLDDCQWADETTLKFLTRWSRNREANSRLMVLLSFRPEQPEALEALHNLTADEHIILDKFDDRAIADIVQSLAGEVPEEVQTMVTRLSGGNPFLAGTVLRSLAELNALRWSGSAWTFDADAIREEVEESNAGQRFIERRIEILPPELMGLLKVAAILGREFDGGMAAQIAGADISLFGEAVRRHIVRAASVSRRYSFLHDRLRETLLSMLDPDERRLHCLHAASLFEQRDSGNFFDLAYYFGAAGEYNRALPYALRAAEEARARSSLEIAEQHYTTALQGLDPSDQRGRYKVNLGLGEVLMLRGRYDRALEVFEQAKALAAGTLEAAHVDHRICETYFKLGKSARAIVAIRETLGRLGVKVPTRKSTVVVWMLKEAVVQVLHVLMPRWYLARRPGEQGEKDLLVCRLLALLGYSMWNEEGYKYELLWSHLKSFNLAELYPPSIELSHVYSCAGPAMTYLAAFGRGMKCAYKGVEIGRRLNSLWAEGHAHNFYGITALPAGRYGEAIDHLLTAAKQLERSGDLWEYDMATCNLAYALYRAGNLPLAATVADRCFQESTEAYDPMSAASALSALAKTTAGNFPVEYIERLRSMLAASACQPQVELGQAEALVHASRGELEDALSILERQQERVVKNGVTQEYMLPVLPWILTITRLKLERGGYKNPSAAKAAARRALRRARSAWLLALFYRNNLPHVLRESGLLHAWLGRRQKALRLIGRSIGAAKTLGARFEQAQSLWAFARVQCDREMMEDAKRLMRDAGVEETFFRLEKERASDSGR